MLKNFMSILLYSKQYTYKMKSSFPRMSYYAGYDSTLQIVISTLEGFFFFALELKTLKGSLNFLWWRRSIYSAVGMDHGGSFLKPGELQLFISLNQHDQCWRIMRVVGQFIAHSCSRGTQPLLLINNLNSQLLWNVVFWSSVWDILSELRAT